MTIAQRIAQVNANMENATRVREFGAYARYLLLSKGLPATARQLAEENNASPRVLNILKSAVAAGSTTDQHWAGAFADYGLLASAFIQSLAPFSAFDTALADGAFVKVPLRTRVSVISSAASASLIGEGDVKPITQLALANQQLDAHKAVAIVAMNQELIRLSDPSAIDLISTELRRAVAIKSDETFLDILTQTSDVASNASSGMSAAQFAADLAEALDSIVFGSDARLYLVVSPAAAKVIAFMRDANGAVYPGMTVTGGNISGIKVVVSNAATDAILFDASQVGAASDAITLDASDQAALQMDDNPTSGATNLISLFQENKRALKAERYFGCEVLRSSAVAVITGVTA